jgi:hypothetical protein
MRDEDGLCKYERVIPNHVLYWLKLPSVSLGVFLLLGNITLNMHLRGLQLHVNRDVTDSRSYIDTVQRGSGVARTCMRLSLTAFIVGVTAYSVGVWN